MAKVRSPWRLLRPLLLAGAVTVSWLTLSSSAASADSSTEPGSLLGGVASSVSSFSAPVASTISPLLETKSPAAPAPTPAGLLQPAVGSTAKTAGQLVAAVPVVKTIVPTGIVSTVAVPVAAAADGAVTGLVDVAVPPLVEAVPILEPVVKPVTDLVTGETPSPDLLPVVLAPTGDLPAALALDALATGVSTEATPAVTAAVAVGQPETVAHAAAASPATSLGIPNGSGIGTASAGLQPASRAAPLTGDLSPVASPAAPASGAGSGASPSGASGAAAWLNDFELDLPLSGACLISEAFEHSPAPVSFDPGSSPD